MTVSDVAAIKEAPEDNSATVMGFCGALILSLLAISGFFLIDFGCEPPRVCAGLLLAIPVAPLLAGAGGKRALAFVGAGLLGAEAGAFFLELQLDAYVCTCWRRDTATPLEGLLNSRGGYWVLPVIAAVATVPILALRGATPIKQVIGGVVGGVALTSLAFLGDPARDAPVLLIGVLVGAFTGLSYGIANRQDPSPERAAALAPLERVLRVVLVIAAALGVVGLRQVAVRHMGVAATAERPSPRAIGRALVECSELIEAHRAHYGIYPATLGTIEGIDPDLAAGVKGDYLFVYATYPHPPSWALIANPLGGRETARANFRVEGSVGEAPSLVRSPDFVRLPLPRSR